MAVVTPSNTNTATNPSPAGTESASVSTLVRAEPLQCYAVAIDIESYPEWAHAISAVEILEHDDEGRVVAARFSAEAVGRRTRYVLEYDYSDAPRRLSWRQRSGDLTTSVDGAYTFVSSADDPGATSVSYELSIGLAVPLPGFVKRRAEAKIVGAALDTFRRRVEGLHTAS